MDTYLESMNGFPYLVLRCETQVGIERIEIKGLSKDDYDIEKRILNYLNDKGYFAQPGRHLTSMYPPFVKALPFDEAAQ